MALLYWLLTAVFCYQGTADEVREIPIPSLQKHDFEILAFKSQKQVFLFRLHGESDES